MNRIDGSLGLIPDVCSSITLIKAVRILSSNVNVPFHVLFKSLCIEKDAITHMYSIDTWRNQIMKHLEPIWLYMILPLISRKRTWTQRSILLPRLLQLRSKLKYSRPKSDIIDYVLPLIYDKSLYVGEEECWSFLPITPNTNLLSHLQSICKTIFASEQTDRYLKTSPILLSKRKKLVVLPNHHDPDQSSINKVKMTPEERSHFEQLKDGLNLWAKRFDLTTFVRNIIKSLNLGYSLKYQIDALNVLKDMKTSDPITNSLINILNQPLPHKRVYDIGVFVTRNRVVRDFW